MNYTTLAIVKSAIRAKTAITVDDDRITRNITDASRAIDRQCVGLPDADALNYFELATVTNELLTAQCDNRGRVICYPHKPAIVSVTSLDYRASQIDDWISVPVTRVFVSSPKVEAYPTNIPNRYPTRCYVRVTYSGGLAAAVADLPADLVHIATLLTIRFYREEEAGLTDVIGVAVPEAAQGAVYTKAFPEQFKAMIQPFIRTVGWRFAA